MNQFTIKDIENLSGVKAHTWRIWEQRYGIGTPQRKDSNHRFYDNENLKQILRISYLYHSGIKISKIARLDKEGIRLKAAVKMDEENGKEYFIKELIEAAIDFHEEQFDKVLQQGFSNYGVEETVLNIIYPFQQKIGMLWLTEHLIPAQEHFTSSIIIKKLAVAIDELPYVKETNKKTIILFTPENEHHEIPLLFIHYLLKKRGNKVIYFGTDVTLDSLKVFSETASFDHIFFHLLTYFKETPDEYLDKISQTFPDKQIFVSGPLVERITKQLPNTQLLKTDEELNAFLKS